MEDLCQGDRNKAISRGKLTKLCMNSRDEDKDGDPSTVLPRPVTLAAANRYPAQPSSGPHARPALPELLCDPSPLNEQPRSHCSCGIASIFAFQPETRRLTGHQGGSESSSWMKLVYFPAAVITSKSSVRNAVAPWPQVSGHHRLLLQRKAIVASDDHLLVPHTAHILSATKLSTYKNGQDKPITLARTCHPSSRGTESGVCS